MIVKFDGLAPQYCEVIKGIMAAKIGLKSFGTFVKQAPDYDERLPLATPALLPFSRWKFNSHLIVGCQNFHFPTNTQASREGRCDGCVLDVPAPPLPHGLPRSAKLRTVSGQNDSAPQ